MNGLGELQSTANEAPVGMAQSPNATNPVSDEEKHFVSATQPQKQEESLFAEPSGAVKDPKELELLPVTHNNMEGQGRDTDMAAAKASTEDRTKTDVDNGPSVPVVPTDSSQRQKLDMMEGQGTKDHLSDKDMTQGIENLSIQNDDDATTREKTKEKEKERAASPTPPPPPPKDDKFLGQNQPVEAINNTTQPSAAEYDEKHHLHADTTGDPSKDAGEEDTRSQIQSIMDQFDDEAASPELEKIMSPRVGMDQPTFHPPRSSSLDSPQQHMTSTVSYTHLTLPTKRIV